MGTTLTGESENLMVGEFRVSLESPHRRKVQRILESAIIVWFLYSAGHTDSTNLSIEAKLLRKQL